MAEQVKVDRARMWVALAAALDQLDHAHKMHELGRASGHGWGEDTSGVESRYGWSMQNTRDVLRGMLAQAPQSLLQRTC